MKKVFTIIFCSFFMLNSFGQMKIDLSKNVTNGTEVFVKSSGVFITPPSGYNYIEELSSFVNKQNNTSISVASKPNISYEQLVNFILYQKSGAKNARIIEKKKIKKGYFFVFQFTVQNKVVERLMYVKAKGKGIVYSMANYKLTDTNLYKSVLKKSILSLQ